MDIFNQRYHHLHCHHRLLTTIRQQHPTTNHLVDIQTNQPNTHPSIHPSIHPPESIQSIPYISFSIQHHLTSLHFTSLHFTSLQYIAVQFMLHSFIHSYIHCLCYRFFVFIFRLFFFFFFFFFFYIVIGIVF